MKLDSFRRKAVFVSILAMACISIASCSKSDPYVIFAETNALTDETRTSLEQRLGDNEIEFRTDELGNVHIKKSDINKAVMCCS